MIHLDKGKLSNEVLKMNVELDDNSFLESVIKKVILYKKLLIHIQQEDV